MATKNKILIIDDDPRNIFALSAVLKASGYDSIGVSSGKEGLEMLSSKDDIGIILMDMMMPEMDGYETIAGIRSDPSLQYIPVIAVTAQAMLGDKEKCLQAGANDYISKPIDVDILMKLLNKFLK